MTESVQHPLITIMTDLQSPPKGTKEFVNGYAISTIYSSDCGWETAVAVGGSNDWHPVTRYSDEAAAIAGHVRWVDRANAGKLGEITDLGLPGWTEPHTVVL